MALTVEDHRVTREVEKYEKKHKNDVWNAYLEGLKIGADPLPHPAEDTPQRPDPTKPGQSPWLPGKSPAPSRPSLAEYRKLMIAGGNPSFDINESPATRRIRGIRKLKERGIGGEAGNASDILKRSIQLPNLQADASSQLREHLKPGTKGLRPYDKSGGGRGIPVDKWLELIRSAPHQAHVDQYLNSLMKIQNREFDDQRSLQYLNSLMKKNRELYDQRSL